MSTSVGRVQQFVRSSIVDPLKLHRHRRYSQSLVKQYLSRPGKAKLQIGAGLNQLTGWLNTDRKVRDGLCYLDATASFPLPSDTFDFIFSEHMIEHVSYADGQRMLKECFRVLKPGGTLRIATPDLRFLIGLFEDPESEIHGRYLRWSTDTFIRDCPAYEPGFVINNFFRDWDHEFIYDQHTLRLAFSSAGFSDIVQRRLNESDHDDLRNLENVERLPDGFLALESMIMEGSKR